MAGDYSQLGIIHIQLANYEKALEYFLKTLQIDQQIGKTENAIGDMSNVAVTYRHLSNYSKSFRVLPQWGI